MVSNELKVENIPHLMFRLSREGSNRPFRTWLLVFEVSITIRTNNQWCGILHIIADSYKCVADDRFVDEALSADIPV